MKNTVNLTLEELDRRIAHFEDRLTDLLLPRNKSGLSKKC